MVTSTRSMITEKTHFPCLADHEQDGQPSTENHFPRSADHEQDDSQPSTVDAQSAKRDDQQLCSSSSTVQEETRGRAKAFQLSANQLTVKKGGEREDMRSDPFVRFVEGLVSFSKDSTV